MKVGASVWLYFSLQSFTAGTTFHYFEKGDTGKPFYGIHASKKSLFIPLYNSTSFF